MKYLMVMIMTVMLTPPCHTFSDDNNRIVSFLEDMWQETTVMDQLYKIIYGFDGKIITDKRETPLLPRLEYPEFSMDSPEIKKVIDLTNMVLDEFNNAHAYTEVIGITTLDEEWKQAEGKLKRKYDNNDGGKYTFVVKLGYKTREDKVPTVIFLDSYIFINYAIREGKTMLLPGLRILFDTEGKVKSIFCFYPPFNEDFVYVLRCTEIGWQFLSFSLEDNVNQPGPCIFYDKEGKILERTMQTLYFRDYNMPVDSEEIILRGLLPHEIWIPSESLNSRVRKSPKSP